MSERKHKRFIESNKIQERVRVSTELNYQRRRDKMLAVGGIPGGAALSALGIKLLDAGYPALAGACIICGILLEGVGVAGAVDLRKMNRLINTRRSNEMKNQIRGRKL